MAPEGGGVVRVVGDEADQLVLMPPYSKVAELNHCIPGCPATLIDRLYKVSNEGPEIASLVWLRRGHVLSITPASFSVGIKLTPQSWVLQGSRCIRVTKEVRSLNSFLSIVLHDEEGGF